MYNKVFLIGRLTRDPEMKLTTAGLAVCRYTVAVDRIGKKNATEKVTDFLRVVAFNRLAEICGQYLKKGKLIAVEGRLQVETYEKDGEKQYFYDVIAENMQMLDKVNSTPQDPAQEA